MVKEKKEVSDVAHPGGYLVGEHSVMKVGAAATQAGKNAKVNPVKKPELSEDKIVPWGENNDFPQKVIKDVRANTILAPKLSWLGRALYSGGIVYGKKEIDEAGNEVLKPVSDSKVDTWLNETKINRYLNQATKAFYYFKNLFPHMVLSNDKTAVVRLLSQRPEYTRYEIPDKNGRIWNCYLNAQWEDGAKVSDAETLKKPVIDPYGYPMDEIRDRKLSEFIYPVNDATPGCSYYQLAEWNSVRESGWLDVAKSIPYFKKSLFKNQLSIKYKITVATWYWAAKYKDWEEKNQDERIAIFKEELDNFEKTMKGEAAAANTIMTFKQYNPKSNKDEVAWEIEAIDDKIKDGIYIEDSQEASSHILFALDLDSSLIGAGPGKKMGEGSGSDKRVAFNMHILNTKPYQDIILEPLDFISEFNGWGYTFWFRNYLIATMDKETQENRM